MKGIIVRPEGYAEAEDDMAAKQVAHFFRDDEIMNTIAVG